MFAIKKKKKKKNWIHRLREKYRLVILRDDTFEKKWSLRLSRLNIILVISAIIIFFISLTAYIIAFTSVREYIPGYTDVNLEKNLYKLQLKADSLDNVFKQKDLYINNLKNIIEGKNIVDTIVNKPVAIINYDTISLKKTPEDSLLRLEIENQNKYNLYPYENDVLHNNNSSISGFNFFTPLKGIITNGFNIADKHYAIDIVSKKNEAVKATLDGTVIFSNWTLETGYVIAIQHQRNMISVYKHNSALLKEEGDFVKAGDPIAIVGESGELSTGQHLHFELWYNGNPINPADYMTF